MIAEVKVMSLKNEFKSMLKRFIKIKLSHICCPKFYLFIKKNDQNNNNN